MISAKEESSRARAGRSAGVCFGRQLEERKQQRDSEGLPETPILMCVNDGEMSLFPPGGLRSVFPWSKWALWLSDGREGLWRMTGRYRISGRYAICLDLLGENEENRHGFVNHWIWCSGAYMECLCGVWFRLTLRLYGIPIVVVSYIGLDSFPRFQCEVTRVYFTI